MKPNILFIMADDHAAHAIGAYGSAINSTRNIDRLAAEGMLFDNCHVSNSICAPSRAAILTGTYNHANRVTTLHARLDNRLPNVAKHLRAAGYQTAIIGKWHLGHGPSHDPTGFDHWDVLPGQGRYHDPEFMTNDGPTVDRGYVTDVITDKCLQWLERRDTNRPFFLMCHHKAPHRPWDPLPSDRGLYLDPIPLPLTLRDDYRNRCEAASQFKVRVSDDLTYDDLDLVQLPESPGELYGGGERKKVPHPKDVHGFTLRCRNTGEVFTFDTSDELLEFKYQRYMRKYLQTVHAIDRSVGRILRYLDEHEQTDNTMVVYTSDQGFFLGDHGWFDKRYMYEHALRMPLLVRYPDLIHPATECGEMVSNVDFAPTFLDVAGLRIPNYVQGRSIVPLLGGTVPADWPDLVYHRYWMNRDKEVDAVAHYGIRTHRYKLIYWYDKACGEPGAFPGRGTKAWELFDLERDPDELLNVYDDPDYHPIAREMTDKLEAKMLEIGDTWEHRNDSLGSEEVRT